jgi:hypothetical protein
MAEPQQPPTPGVFDTTEKLQTYLNSCPPGLTKLTLVGQLMNSDFSEQLYISSLAGLQFPPGLTDLVLSQNRIASLEGVQFPLGLISLNLSMNVITSLQGVHFPPGLIRLYLYTNQIASLDGVQFPSTLDYLYLGENRITSVRGVQFPRGVAHFNFQDNPLTSLAGMINPNQIIKNYFMTYYNSLYLRDIEGEKAVRQSQKAEFARTNDLTQQSMRNQLNAITSFLREGMQARAMEKNESMKTNRFVIFVRMANDIPYRVPYASDMKVQSVLDYLNEHYYISALFPNHGVVRLMFKNEQLDPSRTLGDYGIQNEDTLHAKGKIIQGGGKRRITTRSKRFKQQFNKSKSIKNGHKRK